MLFDLIIWRSLPNDDMIWGPDDNMTTIRSNMTTIRSKDANVHFACFVERDQRGIIAKHFT